MPFDASGNSVAHHVLFHGPALREKSRLLGGPLAEARTKKLIADIGDDPSLSERRLLVELKELQDLLGLRHVHDLDRDESAYFAAIHPGDPVVGDICVLHDELERALSAVSPPL